MECLKDILNYLNTDLIVCGDNIKQETMIENFKSINDIRSAAFYAFGQSKLANKNTVLIINGDYLSNVYTVLTEAWFQKTNLIVIALYRSIYDIETNYLDRCTVSNITFIDKDFIQFKEKIKKSLELIGPKLFNIVTKIKQEKNDYSDILNIIRNYVQANDKIYIYNGLEVNLPCKVNNLDLKYKYGIVSKYLGSTLNLNGNKAILICTNECLEIDLNVLNNKAMNENFKMIVKGNIESLKKWIESNNIRLINCKNLKKDIEELYNKDNKQPTILNIKEED